MPTMSMSASGGKADIPDTPHQCPPMTQSGHSRRAMLIRLLPRLELPFEHCDPVAQLDGFELRAHGGEMWLGQVTAARLPAAKVGIGD